MQASYREELAIVRHRHSTRWRRDGNHIYYYTIIYFTVHIWSIIIWIYYICINLAIGQNIPTAHPTHFGNIGVLTPSASTVIYRPVPRTLNTRRKGSAAPQNPSTGRFLSTSTHPRRVRPVRLPQDVLEVPVRSFSTSEITNIRQVLNASVMDDTLSAHQRHWITWEEFAASAGLDVYLRGYDYIGRVSAICLLIVDMIRDGHNKTTVDQVVGAMKFFYTGQIEGLHCFNDEAITRAKQSVRKRGRRAFDEKNHYERQPFTYDMVCWIRTHYLSTNGTPKEQIDKFMVYIGVALAFNFMWRASEFIFKKSQRTSTLFQDPNEDPDEKVLNTVHTLYREDILVYTSADDTTSLTIEQVFTLTDVSDVQSLLFVIKSSKADNYGNGRRVTISRDGINQGQLIDDVVRFLIMSETRQKDVFLSRYFNGRNLKLTRKDITVGIKAAASAFGLPTVCFSVHSLRIGGATQMEAAHEREEMIDRVGGWNVKKAKNSATRYRRLTTLDHGAIGTIDKSTTEQILSVSHIKPLIRGSELGNINKERRVARSKRG